MTKTKPIEINGITFTDEMLDTIDMLVNQESADCHIDRIDKIFSFLLAHGSGQYPVDEKKFQQEAFDLMVGLDNLKQQLKTFLKQTK